MERGAYGMPRGTTAGDGISAITRLHCIGGGWDLNIINMFTKHLMPETLEDQTRAYLASLAITSTSEQLDNADHSTDTVSSLLSMCKLLRGIRDEVFFRDGVLTRCAYVSNN